MHGFNDPFNAPDAAYNGMAERDGMILIHIQRLELTH